MGSAQSQVIVLRVTVRAPDLETFVQKYAKHLDGDRIFIFTKSPQPVGTRVRFQLQLESGEQLLHGKGTVVRVQADAGDRKHPPGMELVFTPVDERSQMLVELMLATRAEAEPALARAVAPPAPPAETPAAIEYDDDLTEAGSAPSLPPPPKPARASAKGAAAVEKAAVAPTASKSPARAPKPEPAPEPEAVLKPKPKPEAALAPKPEAAPRPEAALAPKPEAVPRPEAAHANGASANGSSALPLGHSAEPGSSALPLGHSVEPGSVALPLSHSVEQAVAASALAPVQPGPAPAFAEAWRPPVQPGRPAAALDGNVPANPFSEVSDGAIEYFVEWSLEQSIGPRAESTSSFSNVAMALPSGEPAPSAEPAAAPAGRRRLALLLGGTFAGGTALGVGLMLLLRSPAPAPLVPYAATHSLPAAATAPREEPAPPAHPAVAPSAMAPSASAPSASAAPTANGALAAAAGTEATPTAALPAAPNPDEAELAITSRPAGALISIDGKPAGTTPTVARVRPGAHELTLSHERYTTYTTSTHAPGRVQYELRRPVATLQLSSTPTGAKVLIGGVPRGKTPLSVRLPEYESYSVELALAGAKPWQRAVYLRAASNQVKAQLVALKPPAPQKPPKPVAATPRPAATTAARTPPARR